MECKHQMKTLSLVNTQGHGGLAVKKIKPALGIPPACFPVDSDLKTLRFVNKRSLVKASHCELIPWPIRPSNHYKGIKHGTRNLVLDRRRPMAVRD